MKIIPSLIDNKYFIRKIFVVPLDTHCIGSINKPSLINRLDINYLTCQKEEEVCPCDFIWIQVEKENYVRSSSFPFTVLFISCCSRCPSKHEPATSSLFCPSNCAILSWNRSWGGVRPILKVRCHFKGIRIGVTGCSFAVSSSSLSIYLHAAEERNREKNNMEFVIVSVFNKRPLHQQHHHHHHRMWSRVIMCGVNWTGWLEEFIWHRRRTRGNDQKQKKNSDLWTGGSSSRRSCCCYAQLLRKLWGERV